MAFTAMSVLPFIGYFLLTSAVLYLVLRVFRYIKSARGASSAASLPKPVSGNAGRSIFSVGRATAWGWKNWTAALPRVPWVNATVSAAQERVPSTKNTKNLSVELLPTTGLPPPPSTTPTASNSLMQTAPLVDIGSPPTPPLTSTSTFSSFPASPRTPPPSHNLLGQMSVKPIYPTPTHHAYPRPPSPHALLATTPPQKHGSHKRSRSLGGVSVRRLSGGTSGLRNAVRVDSDIEVEMKEIRAGIHEGRGHVRGTSREHLLIDFSSSGSSGEEEADDVSPAASDIGVLPLHGRRHPQPNFIPGYSYASSAPQAQPVRVDARTVGRHVPLVDLGDQDTATQDENSLDDAWRWFGSERSSISSSSSATTTATTTPYVLKNTTPFPTDYKSETLVDVDSEEAPIELVSAPQTIHVRHMAADGTHIKDSLHVIQAKPMLVDINDNTTHGEATLVDLGFDQTEEAKVPALVPLSKPESTYRSTTFEAEAGYSHPLEIEAEAVHVQVRPKSIILESPLPTEPEASMLFGVEAQDLQRVADPEPEHPEESPLPAVGITPPTLVDVDVDAGHPSVDSVVSTKPEQNSSSWSWDEVDVEDPWNHHLSMSENTVSNPESDLITFIGGVTVDDAVSDTVQDDSKPEELGLLEMSPGGSLLPTAIEDDLEREGQDGVPVFDLESVEVEGCFSEEQSSQGLLRGDVEFEEEEITPKPTPVSSAVELPEVVVMDVEEEEFVYEPQVEETVESPLEDDEVFIYPDPDLPSLPLHLEDAPTAEQPLVTTLSVFAGALEAQMNTHLLASGSDSSSSQAENVAEKEHLIVPASQRLPSSQTPTPPASPPPTFGSHAPQSHTHTHLRVLNLTTNASSNGSRTPSPVSPTPRLAVVLPLMEQERRGEDKENDTPTAMTVGRFSESLLTTKPLWSIRASDAPALGIPSSGSVLGASPRMRRSVLGDLDSNVVEEVVEAEEEKEEPKEKSEEDVLPTETEIGVKVDSESGAQPALAVAEPSMSDHQSAPPMKLSTSLPGSFPDVEPTPEVVDSSPIVPAATSPTVRRPVPTPNGATATQFVIPSARTLVRSPLDIALAMQMRPGLGAGADPAWMVRFLMAVFGWMAVAVAGGDF